jgi:nitrite reductase/ring-hydroxylating ferredoxin subunit
MKTHPQGPADTHPSKSLERTGRRKFFNRLWAFFGAIATIEVGWLAGSILSSRRNSPSTNAEEEYLSIGAVDSYSPGTVTAVPEGQFYLARLEDGSFLALSRTCTHLGCSLPWDSEAHKFICPCHGSTFDIAGEVLTPPATRGLDSYPLRIENSMIRVNIATSRKYLHNGKPRSVQA